ncbi:hypothetical protein MPER_04295, partial [Moniliophthora perniciosa FA553]
VVSKIMKHARDSPSTSAHGLLLGLDLDGTLEVSNSFPLPHHMGDEDEKSSKSVARYQTSMLRSLKEVQSDDGVVGFYQASSLGAFFSQSLVDTQAIHQDKLRHGGVVVVHDVSQTAQGSASFRAFRLTSAFLDAYKKTNFRGLTKNCGTDHGGLGQLPDRRYIYCCHRLLSQLTNAGFEEGNVGYVTRVIAREKAKAEAYIAKRKEENAERVSKGLVPLPEEDVNRMFKIPSEPSRLESMLLLGKLDALAKILRETSGTSLAKLYGATAGSG